MPHKRDPNQIAGKLSRSTQLIFLVKSVLMTCRNHQFFATFRNENCNKMASERRGRLPVAAIHTRAIYRPLASTTHFHVYDTHNGNRPIFAAQNLISTDGWGRKHIKYTWEKSIRKPELMSELCIRMDNTRDEQSSDLACPCGCLSVYAWMGVRAMRAYRMTSRRSAFSTEAKRRSRQFM